MPSLPIFEEAERNGDGDLIKKDDNGNETNVSELFAPGKRKTSNVEMLVIEARIADEKPDKDMNPAFPMGDDTAEEALARMDNDGLDPAWLSGPSDYRP